MTDNQKGSMVTTSAASVMIGMLMGCIGLFMGLAGSNDGIKVMIVGIGLIGLGIVMLMLVPSRAKKS